MCTPSCTVGGPKLCGDDLCTPSCVVYESSCSGFVPLVVRFLGPVSLINWANCLLLIIFAAQQKSFAVFSKEKKQDVYHEDDVAIAFNKHSLRINKNQCKEDVIFRFEDKEPERK